MPNPTNLRDLMQPAIGQAILRLIGGETFELESPNSKLGDEIDTPPDDMLGFGAAIIRVTVHGFPNTTYAQFIDERCRELFGFGLVREGTTVSLKRRKDPSDSFRQAGYAYGTDSQGRMMIKGDYGNELNIAYMKLLEGPMDVKQIAVNNLNLTGHPYVSNNTAVIYLSDLEVLAKWCGDVVVVNEGRVLIKSGCPL